MSNDTDRFKRHIVDILAKRSANTCSNPDCQAITSGPSDEEDRAIIVGEAAHIYGANPGSARHDSLMASAERSSITNAIWLCRNCHKIIDTDPNQYPAELLFEWRVEHERSVSDRLGKTGDRLKRKVLETQLKYFDDTSYLARQIVIDKPSAWEYRLTTELLRTLLDPVMQRARALELCLYAKPLSRVPYSDGINWFQDRLNEISSLIPALMEVTNKEFTIAWGDPGVPGSAEAILRTCKLFVEGCEQILSWEEGIKFTVVPDDFEELRILLSGLGIRVLNQINRIPVELVKLFSDGEIKGSFHIEAVVDLPDGWADECSAAMGRLQLVYEPPNPFG